MFKSIVKITTTTFNSNSSKDTNHMVLVLPLEGCNTLKFDHRMLSTITNWFKVLLSQQYILIQIPRKWKNMQYSTADAQSSSNSGSRCLVGVAAWPTWNVTPTSVDHTGACLCLMQCWPPPAWHQGGPRTETQKYMY